MYGEDFFMTKWKVLCLLVMLLVVVVVVVPVFGDTLASLSIEDDLVGGVAEIDQKVTFTIYMDTVPKSLYNKLLEFEVDGPRLEDTNAWIHNLRHAVFVGSTLNPMEFYFVPTEAGTHSFTVNAYVEGELVAQGSTSIDVTSVEDVSAMCGNITIYQARSAALATLASGVQENDADAYALAIALISDADTLLENAFIDCGDGFYETAEENIASALLKLDEAETIINSAAASGSGVTSFFSNLDLTTILLGVLIIAGLIFAIRILVFAEKEGKEQKPM